MLANGAVVMDLNCFLKFILIIIIPFLGLLAWLENKVSNSNEVNNDSRGEELVQISDEINLFFEQEEEKTICEVVREYCACSFCGKLSDVITRCSRCKNALYCSEVCHVDMHRRFGHKYECVETEAGENQEGSPSHGPQCLLLEPGNETSKYSFDEVEQKTYEGDVYYIEGGQEEQNSVESSNETAARRPRHGIASSKEACAVCGNPCSKQCSRCKAIKYCSQICQHFDWRSGHKFECFVKKVNSTQATMFNQERLGDENVIMPTNSNEVKDYAYSYDPLCLEFYSEGNTNVKDLILSSQEVTNKAHKEVEEQLRSLKEELEMIKNENTSLQLECNDWEMRARYYVDRLCNFKKENEHQLFILKHENELISNAEKQAHQMVNSLSQRLHCLQIAVETGVAERKKQEEYIHMLQNECAKAKRELHEQNKYVERLKQEHDNATQFPMKIAKETRQKLAITSNAIGVVEPKDAAVEVSQAISLSRNPTFTRQGCAICLTNEKDMAFGCGHMTCRECGLKIRKCHICRKKITNRIRLFPG